MSTGAPTIEIESPYRVSIGPAPQRRTDEFEFRVETKGQELGDAVWKQVDEMLRGSLEQSQTSRPHAATKSETKRSEHDQWRTVAPGIIVSPNEYQRRYGALDLERCRNSMTPEVFKVFVRFIGSVPGSPDLDVVKMTTPPEE